MAVQSNEQFESRSAFIRSLPDIPPAEIIAAAAAQGLEISNELVKKVRQKDRRRAREATEGPVSDPPDSLRELVKTPGFTKVMFVRACPLEMPVKEVIHWGAVLGVPLSEARVYTARSVLKAELALEKKRESGRKGGKASVVARGGKLSTPDLPPVTHGAPIGTPTPAQAFKLLVLRVGMDQARAWMAEMERGV